MQELRPPSDEGYRFPPEVISHAVWRYCRFALGYRDVEDLLAARERRRVCVKPAMVSEARATIREGPAPPPPASGRPVAS